MKPAGNPPNPPWDKRATNPAGIRCPDCRSLGADGAATKSLHDAIEALAGWLRDPEHRAAAAADDVVEQLLVDARTASSQYLEAAGLRGEVLAAAEKVQEKRAATLKLASQLQQFGSLYTDQEIAYSTCWMTAGVVEVDRIQKTGFKLPWFQVQTEEFAMTVRPMFVDDVVRELPDEVKGKYTFSRGNFGFGVDTALIFTRAEDREYKAVTRKVARTSTKTGRRTTPIHASSPVRPRAPIAPASWR